MSRPARALPSTRRITAKQDFASGIGKLAAAGAKVIADDVGYFDEPFFQDGIVAQAIDAVQATGRGVFFRGRQQQQPGIRQQRAELYDRWSAEPTAGEHLLTFGTTGGNPVTSLPVTIPSMLPGEFVAIVLEWDQPYVTGAPNSGGATSRIDLCVIGVNGTDVIYDDSLNTVPTSCTGPNALGVDPVQVLAHRQSGDQREPQCGR